MTFLGIVSWLVSNSILYDLLTKVQKAICFTNVEVFLVLDAKNAWIDDLVGYKMLNIHPQKTIYPQVAIS